MRLLILAVLVAASLALHCPEHCDCGTGDELDFFCQTGRANVTFHARTNEYVNIKCMGTNFTCADLPVFNFSNNLTLPSLGVAGCSPTILRCVTGVLQASSVTSIVLTNTTEGLTVEDVRGLGDVQSLMIKSGAETTLPADVLSSLGSLRHLRVSSTGIKLVSDALENAPPLEFLELSSDKINEIPENAFKGLSKLKIMNAWGNNFSEIGVNALKGLDSLEKITLNTNKISSMPAGMFAHTPKLQSVMMMANNLAVLPAGLLHDLPQLENITIQYNLVELQLEPTSLANLTSLKNLYLQSCNIRVLPEDLLTGSTAIQTLRLNNNDVTSLPQNLFKDQKSLETLDLSFNKIKFVDSRTFVTLKRLESINLNRNHLEVLPDFLFSGLKQLKLISIDANYLTTISPNTFLGVPDLETLSLASNQLTLRSDEEQYSNLETQSPFSMANRLKRLYLSGNKIETVYEDWKTALLQLEVLDLSWNKFSGLYSHDVEFLAANLTVDLRHNHITDIILGYAELPSSHTSTTTNSILIDDNPLMCDCSNYPLAMRLRGARPLTAEPKFIIGDVRCSSPDHLKGKLFRNVSPYELNCELPTEKCPIECFKCLKRQSTSEIELSCFTVPHIFPDLAEFGANTFALSVIFPPNDVSNLSVKTLNISHTGIEEIPFQPSEEIQTIDMSYNNLTVIPTDFLNTNITLYLAGNPFECECWYSNEISALQKSVLVNDLDQVTCHNGDKLLLVDVIALCSSWRAAAVASGTFITMVIIALFIGITIYKYSREILLFIIDYGLCPCCFIEDLTDSDKEYDVFVSFAHKDRKYLRELLPKLEKEFGQKTCLHYRDWYAGDLIPTQIDRSVENSRKTLILLSKNFLESHYANMEFQAAHNLALRQGKSRVILILLDDVTKHEKLSEELKAYMSTNTYLMWDDPAFWRRLQVALPKRLTKKFVWPMFKDTECKDVKSGLDVHLNSEGQLVNVAVKNI